MGHRKWGSSWDALVVVVQVVVVVACLLLPQGSLNTINSNLPSSLPLRKYCAASSSLYPNAS